MQQSDLLFDFQADQLHCIHKQSIFTKLLHIKKEIRKKQNEIAKLLVRVPLMILKYEILPNLSYSSFVFMAEKKSDKIHLYLVDKQQYQQIQIDFVPHEDAATFQFQNQIYFVGGKVFQQALNDFEEVKSVFKVNLFGVSKELQQLVQERKNCGALIYNNLLFAIGGQNKAQGILNSVEMLDLQNRNQNFQLRSNLQIARYDMGVVTYKQHIFAIGGFSQSKDGRVQNEKSIEQYSVQNDKWTFLEINQQRIELNFPIAKLGNYSLFFVFGGINNNAPSNRVFKFDFKTLNWDYWQIQEGFTISSSVVKKGNSCYCWGQNGAQFWKVYKIKIDAICYDINNCKTIHYLGYIADSQLFIQQNLNQLYLFPLSSIILLPACYKPKLILQCSRNSNLMLSRNPGSLLQLHFD